MWSPLGIRATRKPVKVQKQASRYLKNKVKRPFSSPKQTLSGENIPHARSTYHLSERGTQADAGGVGKTRCGRGPERQAVRVWSPSASRLMAKVGVSQGSQCNRRFLIPSRMCWIMQWYHDQESVSLPSATVSLHVTWRPGCHSVFPFPAPSMPPIWLMSVSSPWCTPPPPQAEE